MIQTQLVLPDGVVSHPIFVWWAIAVSLLLLISSSSKRIFSGFADTLAEMRRAVIAKDETDIIVRDRQIAYLRDRVALLERLEQAWIERANKAAAWIRVVEHKMTRAGIEHDPPPSLFIDEKKDEEKK